MRRDNPGWRQFSSTRTTVNPWFHYRLDAIELPNGERRTYAYRDEEEAVLVVPVTAGREVVLVRQYRYAIGSWSIEVPAGAIEDRPRDRPEACRCAQAPHSSSPS